MLARAVPRAGGKGRRVEEIERLKHERDFLVVLLQQVQIRSGGSCGALSKRKRTGNRTGHRTTSAGGGSRPYGLKPVTSPKNKRKAHMRKLGPKPKDHPSVGDKCPACQKPLRGGDFTTLVNLGPGDNKEARALRDQGRAYNSIACEIHWECSAKISPLE